MTASTVGVLVFLAIVSITLGLATGKRSVLLEELAGASESATPNLDQDAPLLMRLMAAFSYTAADRTGVLSWLLERAKNHEAEVDRKLAQAGRPWGLTARDLIVITWAGTIGGAVGGTLLAILLHMPFFLGTMFGGALGVYPRAMVDGRARRRADEIRRALPAMLDLLIMAAQAGAVTAGGLAYVARELPGPLGDEIRYVVKQLETSVDEIEAFTMLANRCQIEEIEEFTQALITATKHSRMTYEQVLENQAERLRTSLEQETEAKVRKLTVTTLIPLVVFFLPAVMIIVIGPALAGLHSFL